MPEKRSTIGRFEIQEKIGEGPIGAVYKALDPVIRRIVAIKVIKLYTLEESVSFPEIFEKIYRVVRTSTALNHPNICIIYDLSEEKKIPYITMEYIDGHDLEWMLQNRNQFKRSQLLSILQQTCDALDFAHKKNVVHQDLKSTNILLTPDLQVKITDFGIAGLDEIAAAQTKKLLSIPFYISPEQALGEKVTPASDLFSLGVIMYQLLSGQLPFPGNTAANVIMMIARDNPVLPKNFEGSGIQREAWDVFFNTALAKNPDDRFGSAREMFESLNSMIPSSDRIRYPYIHSVSSSDSTGVIERAPSAEPTILIDASRMFDEVGAFAPDKMEEETEKVQAAAAENDPNSAFTLLNTALPKYSEDPESATLMVDMGEKAVVPPANPTVLIEVPPVEEPPYDLLPPDPPTPVPAAPTELVDFPGASKKVGASTSEMQLADNPPTEILSGDIASRFQTPWPETPVPPRVQPSPVPPPPRTPPPVMRPTPPPAARPTPPPEARSTPPPAPHQTLRPGESSTPPPMTARPASRTVEQNLPPQPKTPPPAPSRQQPSAALSVEAPYTAPASQRAGAAPPKGAKSALKIYIFGALIVASLIALAGFFFFSSTGSKKEVVEKPHAIPARTEKPKPPQQEEVTIVPTVGTLRITSEPVGASVFLNNEQRGITPLEISEVPFGKYALQLKLKGYKDQQQDVELNADNATLDVPVTLEKSAPAIGTLVIESSPDGAFIVISNKVVGVTPKTLANTKAGKYNITLKKDGYQDYTGTVRVKQDQTAKMNAALTQIPKVVVSPPPPPVKPKEPGLKPGTLVALGPGVTAPKSIKKAFPKYPDMAKKLKLQGAVGLSILVTETGKVAEVKITRSAHPILDAAAVESVRSWVYEPARKNGVVVKVWLPISISFQTGR